MEFNVKGIGTLGVAAAPSVLPSAPSIPSLANLLTEGVVIGGVRITPVWILVVGIGVWFLLGMGRGRRRY